MYLKNYQNNVIEKVSSYLSVLKRKKEEAIEIENYMRAKGVMVDKVPFCKNSWNELAADFILPSILHQDGTQKVPAWIEKINEIGEFVPSICLKVPTGGGKTIIAASVIELLCKLYFFNISGLYLWIVPSDTIYKQTLKLLTNRDNPVRQLLDKASSGRVKILQKSDHFTKWDIKDNLCILLLMLQSSARKTKEVLKVFRDSGKFTSFFPEVDDFVNSEKLLKIVPNLDSYEIDDDKFSNIYTIKQSLANVLKLIKPVIIIDEGHKAYSITAKNTMLSFNPSFMLELSATPNMKHHHSNVLIDVSGMELKNEEMIKLPIIIKNYENSDWKYTLEESVKFLDKLNIEASNLFATCGEYIRPIMLVRVDRTGKDTRDGIHVHADDVKEFLQEKFSLNPKAVRIKSATIDEIGDEDLLSDLSEVRVIISKDALREGWDCSFAYVLTILSKTTAKIALTQMIGRVLRQPYARLTTIEMLNRCYIFCFDQEVKETINSIRKGLEEEGMGDISSQICINDLDYRSQIDQIKRIEINRNELFQRKSIQLPLLSHKGDDDSWLPFEYEQHLLQNIDLNSIKPNKAILNSIDLNAKAKTTFIELDAIDNNAHFAFSVKTDEEFIDDKFNLVSVDVARILNDYINNPWHATRLINEYRKILESNKLSDSLIYANREQIVGYIISDILSKFEQATQKIFLEKIEGQFIRFDFGYGGPEIEMPLKYEMVVKYNSDKLKNKNGKEFKKALYGYLPEESVNNLEKHVAYFLEDLEIVYWWWRLTPNQGIYVTGWKREKIYPDFVALTNIGNNCDTLIFLETKGQHLIGNPDTQYKEATFKLFENRICWRTKLPIRFRIIDERNWKRDLSKALGLV